MRCFINSILLVCLSLTLFNLANASYIDLDKREQALISQTGDLNPNILQDALNAYDCAKKESISKRNLLTIIDYSMPSYEKRFWVFDMNDYRLLFNTWVAHGIHSGYITAMHFSDDPETHESSVGLYETGMPYVGHHGYSLKLIGLEKGFNDHVLGRHIVIHGATYVGEDVVKKYGRLGRSWGCPALNFCVVRPIIDTIKNGTLLFAYGDDKRWLRDSKFIHCPK